jgi:ABC-type Fe3+-hydroxamate transport system substrate-binding protein
MRHHHRARLALAALPLVAGLVLAGCGSSSSAATASGSSSAGATQVITVSYAGGVITPPEGKVPVKVGTHVEIRVTSDVSEIVHNHYNNVEHDVAPGGTVVFDFTATMPGVYEVELHKSDKLLLELQVQ